MHGEYHTRVTADHVRQVGPTRVVSNRAASNRLNPIEIEPQVRARSDAGNVEWESVVDIGWHLACEVGHRLGPALP